jgi:hypothetical protein
LGSPYKFYQQSINGNEAFELEELYVQKISSNIVFIDYFGGDFTGSYLTGELFVLDAFTSAPSYGNPGVAISYYFDGTDGQYTRASTRMECTNTGNYPYYYQGQYFDLSTIDVSEGDWDYAVLWFFNSADGYTYGPYVCVGTTTTNHPQYPGETKFYSKPAFELTDYFGGNTIDKARDYIFKRLPTGEFLISNGSYSALLSLDIPTGIFTLIDNWTSTFGLNPVLPRVEKKADVSLPEGEAWISRRYTHPNYYEIQSTIIKANSSGFVDDTINIIEYHDDTPLDIDLQSPAVQWAGYQEGIEEIWAFVQDGSDGKIFGQRILK